jgi:HK97 family phage portal protein
VSLLFGHREQRSISYQDVFASGGRVDTLGTGMEHAARLVPVYAAWRLISDQFASTPWHAYREQGDGTKVRMPSEPRLVTDPSPVGVPLTAWKTQLIVSMLARGNAYGLRVGAPFPSGIVWLHPDKVSVDESGPLPEYYYQGRHVDRAELVHVPWFLFPGKFVGLSPVAAFRTTLDTGHAAQTTARDWFENGAIPSVHFRNVGKTLKPDEAKVAKTLYKEAVSGRDALVTGNDWTLETIGVPADEARFIETLKLTATQVATIYGIPPEMVGGETGSSLTYATVEQNAQNFLTFTMRPWFTRVEDAITSLLPRPQYVKFEMDSIVRADLKSRMESHEIAMRIGVETNDEARALEDRPPLTADQKNEWLSVWKPQPQTTPGTR